MPFSIRRCLRARPPCTPSSRQLPIDIEHVTLRPVADTLGREQHDPTALREPLQRTGSTYRGFKNSTQSKRRRRQAVEPPGGRCDLLQLAANAALDAEPERVTT